MAHANGVHATGARANATQATVAQATAAHVGEPQQQGAWEPQVSEVFRAQKAVKTEVSEPKVPEVFKNEKAGKTKVEEGQSGEGEDKPFCFQCYKLGHGKLVCKAKLWCDICGSNDHMTGKCAILKLSRLLAHPCGFYHIPHAPIVSRKNDNCTTQVTMQGGVLSIPQLMAELGILIPERWLWNVTQRDEHSFVVPFSSQGGGGDLQRSIAFGKDDIKEHGVSLLFEQ
jgi:hypothetical protein